MNPINFVYWLQGFLEIGNPSTLDERQVQEIKNHIGLVLDKQTPKTYPLYTEHVNKNGDLFKASQTLSQNNFTIEDTKKSMAALSECPEPSNIPIKTKYPTVVYYNKQEGNYIDWWGNQFLVSYNDPPASC